MAKKTGLGKGLDALFGGNLLLHSFGRVRKLKC